MLGLGYAFGDLASRQNQPSFGGLPQPIYSLLARFKSPGYKSLSILSISVSDRGATSYPSPQSKTCF